MMGIERKIRQRKVILVVSADWARRILMKVSLLLALENIYREIPLSFTECQGEGIFQSCFELIFLILASLHDESIDDDSGSAIVFLSWKTLCNGE